MNFDFIAGFVGGGLSALLVPVVMRWWDSFWEDDVDPMSDPKNWH